MGTEQDMYDRLIVAVMNKLNCFKPGYLLLFGCTEVADPGGYALPVAVLIVVLNCHQ